MIGKASEIKVTICESEIQIMNWLNSNPGKLIVDIKFSTVSHKNVMGSEVRNHALIIYKEPIKEDGKK